MNRYGWHWHPAYGLTHYNPDVPAVGVRLQARNGSGSPVVRPTWCGPGMHAHPDIDWGPGYGPVLTFVLVENAYTRKGRDGKFVGTHRTVLWEGTPPRELYGRPKKLLRWAEKHGFRRPSCRRKAAAILKKAGVK